MSREYQRPYRVTLDCGCAIHMRDAPVRGGTRFPCPSNQGHGYRVRWTTSENTASGVVDHNRDRTSTGQNPNA